MESRDEGKFLPMPGGGLHDVAMGSAPIRAAEGSASIGAAQGILWLGKQGAGLDAVISTLFGQRCVDAAS